MSTNVIKAPIPVFSDVDGDPLENGYVYIGEVNKNPETFPVNVYFDSGLTIPAAQPIRTIGGYPSRNGSPAALYVVGEYSITVRDKNSVLVYTLPSATGVLLSINSLDNVGELIGYTTAAENISVNVTGYYSANDGGGGLFNWDSSVNKSTADGGLVVDPSVSLPNQGTGSGTGCWIRQIYDGAVDVRWFGTVGDGVTANDDVAIQKAVNASNNIYIPTGTYVVNSSIQLVDQTIATVKNSDKKIHGDGSELTKFSVQHNDFVFEHTVTLTQAQGRVLFYDGSIEDIGFYGHSGETGGAIKLESAYNYRIEKCAFSALLNDAILIEDNTTFIAAAVNTDFYASPFVTIKDNFIASCVNGAKVTQFSSSNANITMNYIVSCVEWGVKLASSSGRVDKNTIAGNGTGTGGGGITVFRTTGTTMNTIIEQNEIDNNVGDHIFVDATRVYIARNRFINTNSADTYVASHNVRLNNQTISSDSNSLIEFNYCDFRNAGSPPFETFVTQDQAQNVGNIFRNNIFVNEPATVTKYVLCDRYKNFALENDEGEASGRNEAIGSNKIAIVKVGNTVAIGATTETIIPFDAINYSSGKVWNSTTSDYYDITTHQFIVPHKGILKISGVMVFTISTAPTILTFRIKIDAVTTSTTLETFPTATDYVNHPINNVIEVEAGELITITVEGDNAFFSRAEDETIEFRML